MSILQIGKRCKMFPQESFKSNPTTYLLCRFWRSKPKRLWRLHFGTTYAINQGGLKGGGGRIINDLFTLIMIRPFLPFSSGSLFLAPRFFFCILSINGLILSLNKLRRTLEKWNGRLTASNESKPSMTGGFKFSKSTAINCDV